MMSLKNDLKTRRIVLLPLCLGLLLVFNACDGDELDFSRVLLADFDQWDGASSLAVALPGLPNGDRAENIGQISPATIDEISGQSLRIADQIDFIPLTHNDVTEYTISWDGFRTVLNNTANTTITFMDQEERVAFRVVFEGGTNNLLLQYGSRPPAQGFDAIGHAFAITMRPGIDRFDFEFEQNDCEAIDDCADWTSLQFLNPDFDTLSRIRIQGGEYFLDDLSVFVSPPL